MLISILSDLHFGYSHSPATENDCFENAEEAMQKALNSDIILIAGDIFDSRMPKTSVWAKAIKILVKPLITENKGVKLISTTKDMKEIHKRVLQHTPTVAIHGTHERRGRDEMNAVEVLDSAGILLHLHCETIVFEKDGIKVAVHGISGVPERQAAEVLKQWNPKPVEGCYNILMMHQSIDPFIYSPLDPPTITMENLPSGFDLIVDGHIHGRVEENIGGAKFIIPGSTVITQLEKNEAESEKGFYQIDARNKTVSFVSLENDRKFFYEEVEADSGVKENIEKMIDEILEEKFTKLPIIKIKIFGNSVNVSEYDLRFIEKKYAERAVLVIAKDLETPEMTDKIEFMRNLREQKLSVEEIGLQILKKNLEKMDFEKSFDFENAFNLLSEGEVEKMFESFIESKKL
jgi:DNA repair exonuclease SbcCD nuclease subunit